MRWKLVIEAWPFSTGQGAEADQAAVAPRVREILFDADDFHAAVKGALLIEKGVASHDKVWNTRINSLVSTGYED